MSETKTTSPAQERNTSLDSLRGIFALSVLITHIPLIRMYFAIDEETFLNPVVNQAGRIGVTGFFVLSGFLITINLLKAREAAMSTGRKMGDFYLKRILRIWPLYYAVILGSIFVFPYIQAIHFHVPVYLKDARVLTESHVWYYALMPQVPLATAYILPYAEPTWSIGVEEMFYLFAPLFILSKRVKKNMLLILGAVFIIARLWMEYTWPDKILAPGTPVSFWFNMLIMCRFDCILLGCYAGYLYFERHKLCEKINLFFFAGAWVLVFIFTAALSLETYNYFQFALPFAVIVLYAARNANTFLNNKVLAFVGKISFSLYMTHELAIVALHNNPFFLEQTEESPILTLFIITPLATILLGWIVYNIIERPFLILKSRLGKSAVIHPQDHQSPQVSPL